MGSEGLRSCERLRVGSWGGAGLEPQTGAAQVTPSEASGAFCSPPSPSVGSGQGRYSESPRSPPLVQAPPPTVYKLII